MTTTQRHRPHRRIDLAGLALFVVGIVSGLFAFALAFHGTLFIVVVPSVVATTIGALHLTKIEAPHQ